MKIVVIGPNVGMGGVERASSNIANGLEDSGEEVVYLALIPEDQFFELRTSYIEPKDFNRTKMDFIKTIKFIRDHVNEIKPDKIIAFTKFYAALANFALLFSRYKVIITERSSPLYIWPKQVEIFCRMSFALKKPSGVISQTSIASQYHKKLYGSTKYTVIPNAVRKLKLYPEVNRENTILAVGRFNDSCKGFDLLVEAFNLLENKSWRLVFAGGSREEGQYLLEVAKPEVRSRMDFLGSVKDTDTIYSKAGIFAMPSRSEGFPNALAEAMVAGCPCISFDFVAGPKDLIDNDVNGILIEKEDVAKLAKGLDELISNPEKRKEIAHKALEIEKKLNITKITQEYKKFLTE